MFIRIMPIALIATSLACGGSQPASDVPTDADGTEDSTADDGAAAAPKDNIVRDADGDGVPDDQEKSDCESKNETQCKINMACAWSDDGKCVKS